MLTDFKLADVLYGAFGPAPARRRWPAEILVEFAADKAGYVTSRTWHDPQCIEVLSDGSVRVSMRLPALGPVRSWCSNGAPPPARSPHANSWTPSATKRSAPQRATRAGSRRPPPRCQRDQLRSRSYVAAGGRDPSGSHQDR